MVQELVLPALFPILPCDRSNIEMTFVQFKFYTHLLGCIIADSYFYQKPVVFESKGRSLPRTWNSSVFMLALHRLATDNINSCDSNNQSHSPDPST
jgi:hypothetical protein